MYKLFALVLSLFLISCGNPDVRSVINIESRNGTQIHYSDTDSSSSKRVNVFVLNKMVISRVFMKEGDIDIDSIGIHQFNQDDILKISYAYVKNKSIPITVTIYDGLILKKDTILHVDLPKNNKAKFIQYDIEVNNDKIARLSKDDKGDIKIKEIRSWLYENKLFLDSLDVMNMIDVENSLASNKLTHYSLQDPHIPILTNLESYRVKVKTNLSADKYYFIAGNTTSIIERQIKSLVSEGLPIHHTKNNDIVEGGIINANLVKGESLICLVGINKDWSSNVIPIGFVAVDNVAPILVKDVEVLDDFSVQFYGLKKFIDVKMEDSGFYVSEFLLSNTSGGVIISTGDFSGDNVPFRLKCFGDIKTVEIEREVVDYNSYSFTRVKKKERKKIDVKGRSEITFNYELDLRIGDNYIPIRLTDFRGNVTETTYNIEMVRIKDNESSINIINEINNNI